MNVSFNNNTGQYIYAQSGSISIETTFVRTIFPNSLTLTLFCLLCCVVLCETGPLPVALLASNSVILPQPLGCWDSAMYHHAWITLALLSSLFPLHQQKTWKY